MEIISYEMRVWAQTEQEIVELNNALAATHEKPEFKITLLKTNNEVDLFCGSFSLSEDVGYVDEVKNDILNILKSFPKLMVAEYEFDTDTAIDSFGIGLFATRYESQVFKLVGDMSKQFDELTLAICG